jgi:hypothetical protein
MGLANDGIILILFMAGVTAFNFLILKWKFERGRYGDLLFDIVTLALLGWMFKGTMGGMIIAMVASLMVSLYLIAFPPKLTKLFNR